MNIINKSAESLGVSIVKLNIYRICLFVFAPENQFVAPRRIHAQKEFVCMQICLLSGYSCMPMVIEKPDKRFHFKDIVSELAFSRMLKVE